jgi:hypothetical protein
MGEADSGAADEKDGSEYPGGESGMSSELGAGVGRDAAHKIANTLNPDEGADMGAGRDATGKRYMGGEGGESSQEQAERNPGGR